MSVTVDQKPYTPRQPYPLGGTSHADRADALGRFRRQVARDAGRTAVVDGERRWSYGELSEAAAVLAARLAARGVGAGDLVGLSVERGWRVVVGILAIWMLDAAYVPIDPGYPPARRAYIASDARLRHVVVDDGGAEEIGAVGSIDIAGFQSAADSGEAVAPAAAEPPHRLPAGAAYVIYTSGSTGKPKGVVVRHDNLEALLRSADTELPAGPDDVGTVFHSYCFDFSVWEIWRVLGAGGTCVFVPGDVAVDPGRFARLLAGHRVTLLSMVPSVFANLVGALREDPVPLPALREVVFGGEAVDLAAARTFYELGLAPDAVLVNMYGITETTVHVTIKVLDPELVRDFPGPGTPIGRPLRHLTVAVLDADGAVTAPGEIGEMYVAGAGVSSGYLNRPELTGQRFVRRGGTGVWYRTGDLARRDADGELVFIGRCDTQVQLRGHRVELGEIEAVLAGLPGVGGAGVVVVPNRAGEQTLVAGFVPAGGEERPERRLRAALRERLPEYMVPTRLVPLDRLPVTPEGKLDRAALTEHVRRTGRAAAAPAPRPAGAAGAAGADPTGFEGVAR
jgi:nonribosomal peptide synthetase DhbF